VGGLQATARASVTPNVWEVELSKSFGKDFDSLPESMQQRVTAKINQLSRNYFPAGAKKLKNSKTGYRIRIGDWRILYDVYQNTHRIVVSAVSKRSEAYR
jgi:mRNA interferase RelE/StbE